MAGKTLAQNRFINADFYTTFLKLQQMNVYRSLPLRMVSRCWGWLADCRVPKPCRPIVYGLYSTTFGVKIDEAAITDYK